MTRRAQSRSSCVWSDRFATIYGVPEIDNNDREYTRERLNVLLEWTRDHPVTVHERHRNRLIQGKQGNRNPLIDHPDWVERIDFTRGLG